MGVLAELSENITPEAIGELVATLFAMIAEVRGPHWLVDDQSCAEAIGVPIRNWLDRQDDRLVDKFAKLAGKTSAGAALALIFLPIALGEYFRWKAAKEEREAAQQAKGEASQPAGNQLVNSAPAANPSGAATALGPGGILTPSAAAYGGSVAIGHQPGFASPTPNALLREGG